MIKKAAVDYGSYNCSPGLLLESLFYDIRDNGGDL
jgi:hypothetical protein